MEQNHRLALDDGPLFDKPEHYRRLIGKLIYLTVTRPDLSYVVHVLSQFMQAPHVTLRVYPVLTPRETHFHAVTRVLRYIKMSQGKGVLLFSISDLKLHGYCDSDWASCPLTRLSVTGYFVMLGHSLVSWRTKKQVIVARSSAEA
ncbi:uncharacterized mitochondrial protein AtMg00240-like [Gastrolobium bilobum]|uniref:uncharacterized mitochondrial protein AtMg00240-like n=1 Tax=Gastrolobium bilobum TaxID=150636 RepID=UPI002AB13C25|nr:uncharacterized mitochondrial protein AtMg00240-like [Gastrolobium bilobum]